MERIDIDRKIDGVRGARVGRWTAGGRRETQKGEFCFLYRGLMYELLRSQVFHMELSLSFACLSRSAIGSFNNDYVG